MEHELSFLHSPPCLVQHPEDIQDLIARKYVFILLVVFAFKGFILYGNLKRLIREQQFIQLGSFLGNFFFIHPIFP